MGQHLNQSIITGSEVQTYFQRDVAQPGKQDTMRTAEYP